MLGLDPDLRQLVDEARGCDDPVAADRARVTRALAVRLGAGALAAAATTATTAAATTATTATALGGSAVRTTAMAGLGSGAKLAGALVLAGTLGVGASVATRSRHAPAPGREARPTAVTRSAAPAPLPANARGASGLEEEVQLLREAQQAMREGHPDRALALVDEHARRFPEGLLRQERIAVRVLALCALGRTGQARRESEGFLRQWPASPFSTQLRASCGGPRR